MVPAILSSPLPPFHHSSLSAGSPAYHALILVSAIFATSIVRNPHSLSAMPSVSRESAAAAVSSPSSRSEEIPHSPPRPSLPIDSIALITSPLEASSICSDSPGM